MRLASEDRDAICQAIRQQDDCACIYLFGSQVDDHAKGGDIDLLVLSDKIDLDKKLDILAQLHQRLGERRIDLLVFKDAGKPFARLAIQNGVKL